MPEVSKGKVHITQNKYVPIEWFVSPLPSLAFDCNFCLMTRTKLGFVCFVAARNCMRQQVAGRSSQRHTTLPTYYKVVLRTEKVLLCTTKYYSSTTLYYSSTTLYYSNTTLYYRVLHSTTKYFPVLQRTTPYYKVLLRTTKLGFRVRV